MASQYIKLRFRHNMLLFFDDFYKITIKLQDVLKISKSYTHVFKNNQLIIHGIRILT